MSFNLRTDSVTNKDGTGPVELSKGATIPSGQTLTNNGNFNITGVSTVGFLTASNVNVSGVVTATSFVGDGSGLIAVPSVSASKSIALKYIIADPPLRS
jgi:hypothetical protein